MGNGVGAGVGIGEAAAKVIKKDGVSWSKHLRLGGFRLGESSYVKRLSESKASLALPLFTVPS